MRKYKYRGTIRTCTQVTMIKFSNRALLNMLGAFVLLAGSSLAQDRLLTASIAGSGTNALVSTAENSSSNPSARIAEDAVPAAPIEAARPSPLVAVQPEPVVLPGEMPHRFWDRENTVLFAAVAATATADFFTTRANLASGGEELNPVTRMFAGSTPGLAANFGLETAGVIGISYMFHKTGHHKLERLTSFVDIGSSIGAVGYGLTHR